MLKFVNKLPGKIEERLYTDLINWFQTKNTEGFNYYATLLPIIEYVRGRIKEYCEEKKHRQQIKK